MTSHFFTRMTNKTINFFMNKHNGEQEMLLKCC